MKMKKAINSAKAPAAIGPYSQAVLAGDTLYVSGQLPINQETEKIPDGIEAQANQVFTNLKYILEEAGGDLSNVVKTTVLLHDIADFAVVNAIYAQYFNGETLPARAAFQVVALPKNALIEVELIAYIK